MHHNLSHFLSPQPTMWLHFRKTREGRLWDILSEVNENSISTSQKFSKKKKVSIIMSGECVISSALSRHNKNLKWRTSVSALGRTSITAPCNSSILFRKQRKIHPEAWGHADKKTLTKERDLQSFGSSFYTFFLLPLGLPYVNWASHECCLFYLRSSLQSSDLPLFYFLRLSPSWSLATAILDSVFLF